MKHIAITLLAGASFFAATAQADGDWYATAKFAYNTLDDQDIEYTAAGSTVNGRAEFDGGFAAGATGGYRFDNNWRLEGEVLYRTSELDTANIPGVGTFTDGDYSSVAIGVNGLYDFDLFGSDKATAYVGAGVAWLQEIDIDFEENGVESSYSGDDIGFQLMLGARYDMSERWFLETDVRYFFASDIEMTAEENAVGRVVADYEPLSVTAGIGWKF